MLRLFRDETSVRLTPNKVDVVRAGRRVRSRIVARKVVPVEGNLSRDWSVAVAELLGELAEPTWAGTDLRVIVSDHWARYELLPWSVELTKESEYVEHARLVMASTYGEAGEGLWKLTLSAATPGVTRIISALPTGLLDELAFANGLNGIRLKSIQPQLIASFNGWRHRLPRLSAWFAAVDDGSLAALHVSHGHCDRIRSVRLSDDWSVELSRIQRLGRLARDRSVDGPVFVDAPVHLRDHGLGPESGIQWLEGPGAPRTALSGLENVLEEVA